VSGQFRENLLVLQRLLLELKDAQGRDVEPEENFIILRMNISRMTRFFSDQEAIFDRAELLGQNFSEYQQTFLKRFRVVLNGLKTLPLTDPATEDQMTL